MKRFIVVILLVASSITWGKMSVGVMTNEATDQIEARVGVELSELWTVGVLGHIYLDQATSTDWGAGGYLQMAVNPNATFPLADWLPGLGGWLELPDTISAKTYLIGKLLWSSYDEAGMDVDDALSASVGGGLEIGPLAIELLYDIVEGGSADTGLVTSGMSVWFGANLRF